MTGRLKHQPMVLSSRYDVYIERQAVDPSSPGDTAGKIEGTLEGKLPTDRHQQSWEESEKRESVERRSTSAKRLRRVEK